MIRDNIKRNETVGPNSREIDKLKKSFPQYFDKDGKFLIDRFEKMLQNEEIDIQGEGYELNFLGKSYARYLSSSETETVITPILEHNQKEINKNSDNIYLIGDNVDAIKHLLNSYSGQIECILTHLTIRGIKILCILITLSLTKNHCQRLLELKKMKQRGF